MEEENVSNRSDILRKLVDSKFQGTVVGLVTRVLGIAMVLTGIEDIILDESPAIILKPYDVYGYILPERRILLDDIYSVKSFASKFKNPFETRLADSYTS